MLSRTAQRLLVRLLIVVLIASLLPPSSSHTAAAAMAAPQYGPPIGLAAVPLIRPDAALHGPTSGIPPATFRPQSLQAFTLAEPEEEDDLPPGRLLSRGKTPIVSSGASTARNVTDDSFTTYSTWESEGTLPDWLQIDFTSPVTLTGTHIQWGRCGVLLDYTLGVSADGLAFTTVVTRTDVPSDFSHAWVTDTFQARARVVRMTVTDVRDNPESYCGSFARSERLDQALPDQQRNLAATAQDEGDESSVQIATFDVYGSSPLLPDQNNPPTECSCSSGTAGGPFNTRTGALWTTTTDLTLPTDGLPIAFKRTYLSRMSDQNGPLGYGWTHSYMARLIAPSAPGGEAGRMKIIAPDGNVDRFEINGAAYTALPGIHSTLVQTGTTFIQTRRDQSRLIYDATTGRLTQVDNAQGRALDLLYDGADQLVSVQSVQAPSRAITLTYTLAGNIDTMSDGLRTVRYAYTNGDLTGATDVMSRTTSYTYQNHVLTSILNPLGVALERTEYDQYLPAGKVISQTLEDGRWLQVDYAADTTTIATTGRDGSVSIDAHGYTDDDTLERRSQNGITIAQLALDEGFAPGGSTDARGGTTATDYNAMGQPTASTDASGAQTAISYDAQSRPISMTDSLGQQSTMAYDASGNLIQQVSGITPQTSLGFTTIYTYNVRYPAKNWLEEQRGPDGVVTSYSYDTIGQMMELTVGAGTAVAQTTRYAYDSIGRRVAVTTGFGTPLARTDRTEYNADSTVARTIQNDKNGVFDPAYPDEDVITSYGYDVLGRRVWTYDTLGHYDAMHYTADGQVAWSARNLVPLQLDDQRQPIFQTYSPTQPDANVVTRYGYDGLGRTVLVTETGILTGTFDLATLRFSDTTERVTRTEYDALSRPMTVTLNYRPELPIGVAPDVNVQTSTAYDDAGSPIWQRDALGRWTYTEYDFLNHPTYSIRNYENGDPITVDEVNRSWTDGSDTDLITYSAYTVDGQPRFQIDNIDYRYESWEGAFNATKPITDRVTLAEYDSLGRVITTTAAYDPYNPPATQDVNRQSVTSYDAADRVQATCDPLGRWTSQEYDALSRVSVTIQNCRTSGNVAVATGCAAFSSDYPDRNVPTETHYDALGRAFETEDALGRVTHMEYDGLGRVVATTQNYVSGGGVLTDTNVTTRMAYDALGHTTIMTDALGQAGRSSVNGLGQTTLLTDTLGRVSRMGYDGSGAQRWMRTADGRVNVLLLDGLGRVVSSIGNYQNGQVGADDRSDRDLITRTRYDVAGRTLETVASGGQVTRFGYNLLDRLITVTENAADGACANAPCNVVTQYQYDRMGNRTAIIDPRGNVRRFSYDAADQPVQARDALNQVTGFQYDQGGRLTFQDDPRGAANDLSYSYDNLDHLTQRSATNLGTIGAQYDALGRRTSLADGTGTTSFDYDALGRMRSVQAPATGHIGYDYDARGARTKLIYPDGSALQYGYWPDGQLHVVTGTTTLASYAYDTAGRLQSVARTNGATTTYGYDGADRLRDLHTTVDGDTISRFAYATNRLGLRTAVIETLPLSGTSDLMRMSDATAASLPTSHTLAQRATQMPLAFVPNQGQSHKTVRYQVRALGGTLFFAQDGVALALPSGAQATQRPAKRNTKNQPQTPTDARSRAGALAVVRLRFAGANPDATIEGVDRLPGVVNDLRGNDQARWRSNLPTYAGVVYRQLYRGIDVRYDGVDGHVKSTYTVAPGANPAQIRWRYDGARDVRLDADGNLVLALPVTGTTTLTATNRTLTEQAPRAWQIIGGRQVAVEVHFTLAASRQVRFAVGAYDRSQPLIIDPALIYSVLIGGSTEEFLGDIAQDSTGAVYLTGSTSSSDYPISGGVQGDLNGGSDVYVTKLSSDGAQVVYSTYLGGTADDWGSGIAVNSAGEALLTGGTTSTDFPTANAIQNSCVLDSSSNCQSAFVTRLSADGSTLSYSTYLGGSDYTSGYDIAVDADGAAYVTGETLAIDFPTVAALQGTCAGGTYSACGESFATKVLSDGSALAWSTYLGGSGSEYANAIAVDADGAAYLTGSTSSTDFPTTNALQSVCGGDPEACSDAFVTKLSADGQAQIYSTFLGGTSYDNGNDIAVDGTGNAAVTGTTESTDFPITLGARQTTHGGQGDAFVIKFTATGTALAYSTFLGGQGYESGYAIALDSAGNTYVTGSTGSLDFPTVHPIMTCQVSAEGQCSDAFVTAVSEDGSSFAYSTYLGGTADDWGMGVVADSAGVATVAGTTYSSDLLTTTASIGGVAADYYHTFVVQLGQPNPPAAAARRVLTYAYDGLQRLTGVNESPGTTYAYSYDDAGNRTGVWLNGTRTLTQTFNAANQIDGFTYDAAGNLTGDGTATATYDALGRMIGRGSTPYTYNGDGTLVDDGTMRYTQDLASPLSQILQTTHLTTTTDYLYGLERLAAQSGSAKTWYVGDALGSVRLTLDDTGAPLGVVNYDPWGTPESGSVPTFGFTGELQDSSSGMVNLRARWYATGQGRFVTRDPFEGFPAQPYSLNPYQYGYSDPVLNSDPSGRYSVTSHEMQATFSSVPVSTSTPSISSLGHNNLNCNSDSITLDLIDLGFVVGFSAGGQIITVQSIALESVWDLLSFEHARFQSKGSFADTILGGPDKVGISGVATGIGLQGSLYWGAFQGLANYSRETWGVKNYAGGFSYFGASLQLPFDILSVDVTHFRSHDGNVWGNLFGLSAGVNVNPTPGSIQIGLGGVSELIEAV